MTDIRKPPLALAWVVWGVAELLYIVAILNRTSLSALGPTTQEHFGISATTLSSFAVLQLVVYAAMQIPVGVLLDRFGMTTMLLSGGMIMFVGQLGMAMAEHVWVAIAARMLIGAGDACTFISVMRMLPDWFPVRKLPMLGQLTGLSGSVGQLISVIPFSLAVGTFGWASGFTGVAAVGLLVVILGVFTLRDRPGIGTAYERLRKTTGKLTQRSALLLEDGSIGLSALPSNTAAISVLNSAKPLRTTGFFSKIRTLLSIPGVRLAFWIHFTSPFAQHVFLLLWGTPFLIGGIGLDAGQAATILTSMVFVGLISGVSFGRLTSRFVEYRVHIVIGVVIAIVAMWILVLSWPGVPPVWLVLIMTTIVAMGGSASMVSFEVTRSYAPRRMSGLATGLVNMGGFIAALIVIFIIGLLLDAQGAGSPDTYRLEAFRVAFAAQILLWVVGITLMLTEFRKTRRWVAARRHTES